MVSISDHHSMDILNDVKLDEFFSLWITDPYNRPLLNAISDAALDLEEGKDVDFDFSLLSESRSLQQQQSRHLPPVSSSVSSILNTLVPLVPRTKPVKNILEARKSKIPTFYKKKSHKEERKFLGEIASLPAKDRETKLSAFFQTTYHLPSCFAPILLSSYKDGEDFTKFIVKKMSGRDPNDRFFRLLAGKHRDYIFPNDLVPYAQAIVENHASLQFLKGEQMFQEKFIEFIVTRCFYLLDPELRGTAGVNQFRKIDLAAMFLNAERMVDVNDCQHVFNYQHFYVAFCKFWDLDTDSDGIISKDDLFKFNDAAITPLIIDRFFNAAFYPRSSSRKNVCDFTSFVYFLMSTEDKSNLTSINLWFKLCDLDDDGVLSMKEIEELYDLQYERMRVTGNETIPFDDILRQLMDLIHAEDAGFVTVADLLDSKMADVFFNTLFDLQKFLVREYQFPVNNPNQDDVTKRLTPWELFVLIEYDQLVNDAI